MTKMRNSKVIQSWIEHQPATNHRGTLWTDGSKLFSYRLQIGDTAGELKILKDYTAKGTHGFQSQTTSCHVGRARVFADLVD